MNNNISTLFDPEDTTMEIDSYLSVLYNKSSEAFCNSNRVNQHKGMRRWSHQVSIAGTAE